MSTGGKCHRELVQPEVILGQFSSLRDRLAHPEKVAVWRVVRWENQRDRWRRHFPPLFATQEGDEFIDTNDTKNAVRGPLWVSFISPMIYRNMLVSASPA